MTLPSLLRHVGVNVPRGVSVDGRIVTGHAAASTVTPLAPHTFHGGTPAAADVDVTTANRNGRAWWNTDAVARGADVSAVEFAFPGFHFDGTDGDYRFEGVIDTGRGRFRVAIMGNPTGGLPHVVPIQPHSLGRREGKWFRRSLHLYDNGNLCVAEAADWHPDEHSTVTVIAWAAHWYAAYCDWRLGGPWPTSGYQPSE